MARDPVAGGLRPLYSEPHKVKQLLHNQRKLVSMLAERLGTIRGVKAVVLGGSHARGLARRESDIDLGILYSESDRFSIQCIRELASELNDTPAPIVCGFYEWGPWVNGGAWLTIGGQRVDLLYRGLEHVERVIGDAEAGKYQLDYAQQPPFGFFSATYLGEVAVCIPLFDPDELVEGLKRQVADYPKALRRAVVQDQLWAAKLDLVAFAPKFALRGDVYGTSACLTRAVNLVVLALYALNRKYVLSDKTAFAEIADFGLAPQAFGSRVQKTIADLANRKRPLWLRSRVLSTSCARALRWLRAVSVTVRVALISCTMRPNSPGSKTPMQNRRSKPLHCGSVHCLDEKKCGFAVRPGAPCEPNLIRVN
jgi:predicted nucleotidyltransferase